MAPGGGGRRQRRRDKPKTNKASTKDTPRGPTTVRDVPDHLLECIFLRLGSASACRQWCSVVADAGFQRRFRSLRAPHVAGHYHVVDTNGGRPIFVPSSTLTIDGSRFALDFLPENDEWKWYLADSSGGLLLLVSKKWRHWKPPSGLYPDLAVCEPLTRRYQLILLPWHVGYFLLDGEGKGGGGGSIGMSNFKVIAVQRTQYNWVPFVFTSGNDGGWRLGQSVSRNRSTTAQVNTVSVLGRAYGSLYLGTDEGDAMLALDETTAEFSRVVLPENIRGPYHRRACRVIGGDDDDGSLRVVRVEENNVLKVYVRLPDSSEWFAERILRLPEATGRLPGREVHYFQDEAAVIVAANDTSILLTPGEETWLFSVELETMELERAQERNKYAGPAYPCELPWPPALEASPPCGRRRKCH